MKLEQIYTGCLANAAYYIESAGEAVIIDPLRETESYVEKAKTNKVKIKYVLETQFNANFASCRLNLAKKTGAIIVCGPTIKPNFKTHVAQDNEELKVGNITIKVMYTPGYTMESTTYLLKDEKGKDYAIFTGNTLFYGDAGRPYFANKKDENTPKDLAGFLFDSLRNKVMPLADDVIVYPGYRGSSACGKKMKNKTKVTLGNLKMINSTLRSDMSKKEFVEKVTRDLVEPSPYFPKNMELKKMVYERIDKVRERGVKSLDIRAFKAAWGMEEALVLDTRDQEKFVKGFIPGSIFMGIEGSFASWVSTLISDVDRSILFIVEPGLEEEVVTRLARVGYDNIIGYLEGGFETWKKAEEQVDVVEEVIPIVFAELYKRKNINILDCRKEVEFNAEHFVNADKFPLDCINKNMHRIKRDEKYYLYCKSGYRSLVAASILKARGIHDVVNVKGGYRELSRLFLKRTKHREQVTGF